MLKVVGELCNVDKLGRIVIPKRIRRIFELDQNSCLEMLIDDDKIIMKKYVPQCIFCGSTDELEEFKGKCVCKNCMNDLNK